MKIIQVVPHVRNEASGPSYSCVRLSRELAAQGQEVILTSLMDGQAAPSARFSHLIFEESTFPPLISRSPQLRGALIELVRGAELIHNHSLWLMPNVYPGWAAQKTGKPLIVSPRGTMSDYSWSRSRFKKRLFWAAMQGSVVRNAAMLHATSESELVDIRRKGLEQPVCVVPNGIDIPEVADACPKSRNKRQLLFLARIHPTKGVDILLRAWARISVRHPDWELRIVGPDNGGYLDQMKSLATSLALQRVRFLGPLFGEDKLQAYRSAEIYILPTHSENFGVSVAEALAAGTPAIVTKGAPWAGLERQGAGWWVDIGLAPLIDCLDAALTSSPEDLKTMGTLGRNWVASEFSWDRVAEEMIASYRWLLGNGARPDCVHIN